MKFLRILLVVGFFSLTSSFARAQDLVQISEFMALNNNSIEDEDGSNEDWIELHNIGTNAVNLAGWYLTDTTNNLKKWMFPSVTLASNAYLIVFASNKDRTAGELHTNFKLSGDGEYLGLIRSNGVTGLPASPAQAFHDSCLAAVKALDAQLFEKTLQKAVVALGHQGLLRQLAGPLAQTIGELWRTGAVTAAHEHFLTAGLKVFLGHLSGQFPVAANAPRIIIATPAGQLHELGAVIVKDAAAQIGWHTTYLGASLPAAEIAGAAVQNYAVAVALSIVYPEDDPDLPQELTNLRRFLPPEIKILVGGRAAPAYSETLLRIGVSFTESIDEFCNQLDELRRSTEARRT